MVIKMDLKNVIRRGKKFYFRMRVPKDCIEKIGKREIVQSLKTDDPVAAKAVAEKLTRQCQNKFKACRTAATIAGTASVSVPVNENELDEAFREQLVSMMTKNLPTILNSETNEDLKQRLDFYRDGIVLIKTGSTVGMNLPEIGVTLPMKSSGSPGSFRRRQRAVCELLEQMSEVIASELGIIHDEKKLLNQGRSLTAPDAIGEPAPAGQQCSLSEAAQLMVSSRRMKEQSSQAILADVRSLKEWFGGKDDVRAYTKRDLIDFIQNALPYIPSNIKKKKQYEGKSLRECVALTKAHPDIHTPISLRTCKNRQVNLITVFNYAKNHLGWISSNPVKDIEVPEVRVTPRLSKGYSPEELSAMWNALAQVRNETRYPSRYWTTVLALYHGFRLNEVCSLFLKDVYETDDGVFVIDINADGPFKSVKNKNSVRIVPVHPYVRDHLGFRAFVEEQGKKRSEGTLFEDVLGRRVKGYRARVSHWFSIWKKEWLPAETQYKHFHDLRHTFIQTAQNVAKMPDRHAQEITGHSVAGVSDVHLAYSGRLKPVDLLPELEKVRYGWEEG